VGRCQSAGHCYHNQFQQQPAASNPVTHRLLCGDHREAPLPLLLLPLLLPRRLPLCEDLLLLTPPALRFGTLLWLCWRGWGTSVWGPGCCMHARNVWQVGALDCMHGTAEQPLLLAHRLTLTSRSSLEARALSSPLSILCSSCWLARERVWVRSHALLVECASARPLAYSASAP